jgi:ABC-type multidrug transport system permease subunit
MVMMMGMMGTAMQTLLAFPQQRPIFVREYSTNHYSVVSYFLSRFTVEAVVTALQVLVMVIITFWLVGFQSNFGMFYLNIYGLAMASSAISIMLGSVVEDPKLAQEMVPMLFVPQLLFAGFFVSPDLMPSWLAWARFIFPLTYSVKIGLVEEFGDGCGGGQADIMCEGLLESIDADPDDAWWYWLVVVGLFLAFRLLALFLLRRKATKFF